MPNLADVARHAGVSLGTASNYVNGKTSRMRRDVYERVREAIDALGYRPNQAARLLKTGATPLIGILVPSVSYPTWGWLAREVEIVAHEECAYRVLVGNTDRKPSKEISFLKDLLSHGIRGAIIVSPLMKQSVLDGWVAENLVAVSYDRRSPKSTGLKVDYVSMDNRRAMSMAVECLVEHGHKNIAFVTASGKSSSRIDKAKAFVDSTRKAGIASYCRIIEGAESGAYGDDDEMLILGRQIAEELARGKTLPTGIIALNDMLAIGLLQGLRTNNFSVPEDVSIIGMDGLLLPEYLSPALTSVKLPMKEMARAMVKQIALRLRDSSAEPIESIFEPELVNRGSVSVVRAV